LFLIFFKEYQFHLQMLISSYSVFPVIQVQSSVFYTLLVQLSPFYTLDAIRDISSLRSHTLQHQKLVHVCVCERERATLVTLHCAFVKLSVVTDHWEVCSVQ